MRVMKREHGHVLRISSIHGGEEVEFDEKRYYKLDGELVKRVRIFGVVIFRYDGEENKFATLTVDDGSDTIRIKVWSNPIKRTDGSVYNQYNLVDGIQVGDVLDIIGKVRYYSNEFYISPTSLKIKNDIDWEINRRATLLSNDFEEKGMLFEEPEIAISSNPPTIPIISDEDNEDATQQKIISAFSQNVMENTLELLVERTGLSKETVHDVLFNLRLDGRILSSQTGYYQLLE